MKELNANALESLLISIWMNHRQKDEWEVFVQAHKGVSPVRVPRELAMG
jgi:hypothetical protein